MNMAEFVIYSLFSNDVHFNGEIYYLIVILIYIIRMICDTEHFYICFLFPNPSEKKPVHIFHFKNWFASILPNER